MAQVVEFLTNTGDCFISDKQLAEQFGVSESTISRELKKLETMGLIVRETKNVKGGKERHIKLADSTTVNLTIEKKTIENTTSNLTIDNKQNDICTIGKLPIVNRQNDLIKDNIKDKLKEKEIDKKKEIPEAEGEKGTRTNPHIVKRDWLIAHHNEIVPLANGLFGYGKVFVKLGGAANE